MEEIKENILELVDKLNRKEAISEKEYVVPGISSENQRLLNNLADLGRNDLTDLMLVTKQVELKNIEKIDHLVENLSAVKNELEASNLELENLFSSIQDMLIVLDKNKRITKVNDSVGRVLGYKSSELLNKKFDSLFNSNTSHKNNLFELLAEQELLDEVESSIMSKNQLEIPVIATSIRMINDKEELQGYVLKLIDTRKSRLASEIQAKREQLIKSEKLVSLGQMAGGIAHEINNPLAIITAKVGLLQMKLKPDNIDKEYIETGLEIIKDTAIRISSIVSNLKAFFRDSTNDNKDWFCLHEIIMNTLSFCNDKFIENNIPILVEVSPEIKIYCQNILISQVIMNLLNNSFDAINGLPEKWIKLEASVENGQVQLLFSDSGNGIDAEISDRIFTPFYTTKEVNQGTGLGLSLVDNIMKNHHGKIFVNPMANNTQFVLEFPFLESKNNIEA